MSTFITVLIIILVICIGCAMLFGIVSVGFLAIASASSHNKRKRKQRANRDPESTDPDHPNNTPDPDAKPYPKVQPEDGTEDTTKDYASHYATDIFDNKKFTIPVGLVAGFILDPDTIYAVSKKAWKAMTQTSAMVDLTGNIMSNKVRNQLLKRLGQNPTPFLRSIFRMATAKALTQFAGKMVFGATPVGIIYSIIDITGLILDLVDPKGYKHVLFNEKIEKQKLLTFAEARSFLSSMGITEPLIHGPVNDLSEEEKETQLAEHIKVLLEDPYRSETVFLTKVLNSKKFNDGKFADPAAFESFVYRFNDVQPFYPMFDDVQNRLCLYNDGRLVQLTPHHPVQCTYKTRESCESYTWPNIKDDEVYTEWDDQREVCTAPFYGHDIRETCENDKFARMNSVGGRTQYPWLDYNRKRVNCDIGPVYCKAAGISYRADNYVQGKYYGPDCYIPQWQKLAELLTSQYLIRAFRG